MSAKLVAEEGLLKELVLSFDDGDHWVIGRDPDACQLLVEDPTASRRHVLVRRAPDGLVAENLSATNPIQINEETPLHPRTLTNGDLVKIGNSVFRFYSEPETHLERTTKTPEQQPQQQPRPEEQSQPRMTPEERKHDTIFEEEDEKEEIAKVNFDLVETGRWLLKIVSGPNSGAEFSMQTSHSYVIGTDPNTCDIVLYDNSVSRQHARISITAEDTLYIEDLKSRNGTRIESEQVKEKRILPLNSLVYLGTTSFVVYDREGEMQTIISPLLPAIVKVLQKEEMPSTNTPQKGEEAAKEAAAADIPAAAPPPKKKASLAAFILTGVLIGIFAIVGLAVQTLFVQQPVVVESEIDKDKLLNEALSPFPGVKFSFNATTGRLLLVGHVASANDKNQLEYNLQGLKFIKDIDSSGVIIDEYVWSEVNQVLSRNPSWRGIIVHSPTPGRFVVSGYLHSRDQAAAVWDYLTRNFPYLDLLENKIIVEEDVLASVRNILQNKNLNAVVPEMNAGEVSLTGTIAIGTREALDQAISEIKNIPGTRSVRNLVNEKAPSEAVINITDRYSITGTSRADGGSLSVIINGRILSEGDILDGMKITTIHPDYVLLQKDQTIYRIDMQR